MSHPMEGWLEDRREELAKEMRRRDRLGVTKVSASSLEYADLWACKDCQTVYVGEKAAARCCR